MNAEPGWRTASRPAAVDGSLRALALPPMIAAGLVLAFGWPTLAVPLNGDTALFHIGAGRLLEGDALYRDWWDLKAPGVYLLHMLARLLFGSAESAIHVLGLVMAAIAAATTTASLRPRMTSAAARTATGVLVVAPYLLAAGAWHLSQPAYFAGLAILFGLLGCASGSRPAALAGGGALMLAASIKFSAIAPALVVLLVAPRGARPAAISGAVLTLAAIAGWLTATGASGEAWTTLTHWRDLADAVHPGATASHLPDAARWYLDHHLFLVAAAAAALVLGVPARRPLALPLSAARLGLVLLASLAGIMTERFAGWPFDFFLISPLLGLLAAATLEHALRASPASRWRPAMTALGSILILAPALPSWWHAHTAAVPVPAVREAAAALPRLPDGPIYVFGDPQLLMVSGRPMAGSVHGWAWELQPATMAARLLADWAGDPPVAIHLSPPYEKLLRERYRELADWIDARTRPLPGHPGWRITGERQERVRQASPPA